MKNLYIKNSGNRTKFNTGKVRDIHTNKGRYDLLPWNIKVKTIKDRVFNVIDKDIRDCSYSERLQYYHTISKEMVVGILEEYIENNKLKGGN